MIKLQIDNWFNKQTRVVDKLKYNYEKDKIFDYDNNDVEKAFLIYNDLLDTGVYNEDANLKQLDDFLKNFVESNTGKTNTFKLKNLDFNVNEHNFKTINYYKRGYKYENYYYKDRVENIDMVIKPKNRETFFKDLCNTDTYIPSINGSLYWEYIHKKDENMLISLRNKIQKVIDKYSDDLEIIKNKNLVIDDASVSENIEQEKEPIDFSKTNKRVMKM